MEKGEEEQPYSFNRTTVLREGTLWTDSLSLILTTGSSS